jgi:hypothetical protein
MSGPGYKAPELGVLSGLHNREDVFTILTLTTGGRVGSVDEIQVTGHLHSLHQPLRVSGTD